MKNCIRPPYEKLKSLKLGFIENSNFENNRDPCCPAEKNLHVWPTQWRDPMTRHSAAKKYSSRTVCQIDSNVHFADHCSHAITPQWCQYQTGSPHWQCVDRVEDKYTCILQQATCWQRPLLLCPQVDRSTAPLKSIPALRLVGGPANRSLVAASRLMKERLMSRKLDTGQETEKRPRSR